MHIIRQFHFINVSPIFLCLFQKILTLYFWIVIIATVIFPVILIFIVIRELWKFLAMHTQDLISKFIGHIAYHFLYSFFFNRS